MTGTIRLVEQEALRQQNEKVTRTAQEALARILRQLESLDFRLVKSADDYLMDTIRANIDNDRLSDADFRSFVRNSLATDVPLIDADGADAGELELVPAFFQAAVPETLYCTKCGGVANPLGYNQWACNECKSPLGKSRVTTNPKHHKSI